MITTISNVLLALGAGKRWPQIRPDQYNAGGGIPIEAHLSRRETERAYNRMNQTAIGYSERRDVSLAPMVRKSASARAAHNRMTLEIERAHLVGYWAGVGGRMPNPGSLAANLIEAPGTSDTNLRRKLKY